MSTHTKPAVLFVCRKNGGKSQMAAGLMRLEAGDSVDVSSAGTQPGTQPGTEINALSAEVLLELGADIRNEHPTALTKDSMRRAGLVVVLGAEAQVDPVDGVRIERWETDEPSLRGIGGRERMELVRDDFNRRVLELKDRLLSGDAPA